jgi:hypothetical protein
MPRHADYQADSSPVLLGSWGQTIKKVGAPEESAWDEDDLEGYVEALRETSQNFIIYDIMTKACWTDLISLLELLRKEGSDIRVVAAMNAPDVGGTSSMWFGCDKSTTPEDCAESPTLESCGEKYGIDRWNCEREVMVSWLRAWRSAARTCSALSTSYPNLVGFTINDFVPLVESPAFPAALYSNRLTISEVALCQTDLLRRDR